MKKIILAFCFISLLTGVSSCISQKIVVNREVETSDGEKMLLGTQTMSQFNKEPYNDWYSENYNEYDIDKKTFTELKKQRIQQYKITIFIGTWCGDSKREFPRLMKILNRLNYPEKKLTIIGVNRAKESPDGKATLNGVRKVPTIIIEKYGKEVGRIIEMPESGFIEKDLLRILKKDDVTVLDLFN